MTTSLLKPQYILNTNIPQLRITINQPKSKTQPIYQVGFFYTQFHKKKGFMVSSSSNNSIQKSNNPYQNHSFHTSSIPFALLLLLPLLLLFSSLILPIFSPNAQMRDPKWVLFGIISPLLHFTPQFPLFLQIKLCIFHFNL